MGDKETAYILFRDGVPQNEIARIYNKTEQTIVKWKKDGDWENRATREQMATASVQEDAGELLRYQLQTLKTIKERYKQAEKDGEAPRLISKGDLDGIRDLFNITKVKELEFTQYVRMVRELLKFMKDENLALAQACGDLFDEFLNTKRKTQ